MLYAPVLVATSDVSSRGPLPDEARTAKVAKAAELRPLVRAVVAAVLREDRDHPDVEDATHEAMARAIAGIETLRDEEALRPWVTGIARHVALDLVRAKKRERARTVPTPRESGDAGALDAIEDPAPPADDRFEGEERLARVQQAMRALPDGPRRALELFHGEGLSYQEVAAILRVPLGTVATWVTRARKELAEKLRDDTRQSP